MKHFTNTNNPIDFPKSVDEIDAFIDGYADRLENMSDLEWDNLGKSMLKHAKGNLLDLAEAGDFDIVVQGCNCFNAMGGGIAKEIAQRYPQAPEVDNLTMRGDIMKLGNWTDCAVVTPEGSFELLNAYTQYSTSKQGEDVFEYGAFELICRKLVHKYGDKRIGLPYIGMGLAGGDSETIMDMIEDLAHGVALKGGSVTLVEFA